MERKRRKQQSRRAGMGELPKPLFTVMNDNFPRPLTWDTPWTLCCHANVELDTERIEGLLRSYLSQKGAQDFIAIMIPASYADGRQVPIRSPEGSFVHKGLPVLVRTYMYANAVGPSYGAEKLDAVTSLATSSAGPGSIGSLPDNMDLARFTQLLPAHAPSVESDVESLWGYDMPVELDEL